jgi:hypothetical protein
MSAWYEEAFERNTFLCTPTTIRNKLGISEPEVYELCNLLKRDGLITSPGEVKDAKLTADGVRQAERSEHTSGSLIRQVLLVRKQILSMLNKHRASNPERPGIWINQLFQMLDSPSGQSKHAHFETLLGCGLIEEVHTNEYAISVQGLKELERLEDVLEAPSIPNIAIPKFGGSAVLTGAGFTANFGGFLAKEFFNKLYREITDHQELLDQVYEYSNFEEALFQIEKSGDEVAALTLREAIRRVYFQMDDKIQESIFPPRFNVSLTSLSKLLSRVCATPNGTAFLFTLNQDLFLERCFWHHEGHGTPVRPGTRLPQRPHNDGLHWFGAHHVPLDDNHISELATPQASSTWPPELTNQYNYIKLHGSMDWRSPDGYPLVVGGGKTQQLIKYPLLRWYLSVFSSVLSSGGARLLVIGYGFADPHINRIISRAVRTSGLELFVWDRCQASELRKRLKEDDEAWEIASAIKDFSDMPMSEVLPSNQAATSEFRRICNWLSRSPVGR